MKPQQFIGYYNQGFGEKAELPLVFWYTEEAVAEPMKYNGCYIGRLKAAREGAVLSMNSEYIACPGGKLYAGFVQPRPGLSNFISVIERYKKDAKLAEEFLADYREAKHAGKWINFARIDKIDSFDGKEGVIFFATPDMLSGLVSWCMFDTNAPDAVSALFSAACGSITAQVMLENERDGRRTFLGMFDPSARPGVEENILTYAIPAKRFREMCDTMPDTFLIEETKDWKRVKERMNHA